MSAASRSAAVRIPAASCSAAARISAASWSAASRADQKRSMLAISSGFVSRWLRALLCAISSAARAVGRHCAQERVDLVRRVAAKGNHEPLVLDFMRCERHVPLPSKAAFPAAHAR